MNMSTKRCYQLLGLPDGSSRTAAREAYQRLALAYHPDRNPGAGEVFSQISEAYQVLNSYFDSLEQDIPEDISGLPGIYRERRGRRGHPTDRRFEIILEGSYLGTSVRQRI
ncbi:MAG: hypothetical protein CBE36_00635 [Oceanospirillaceae bacterium TMED276]|nr:MAG: hypothetical protein CBE36_00635 [Oceanospirillaceae bacterium TMED276]